MKALSTILVVLLLAGCSSKKSTVLHSSPEGIGYRIVHDVKTETINIELEENTITISEDSFMSVCPKPSPFEDLFDFLGSGLIQLGTGIYLGSQ